MDAEKVIDTLQEFVSENKQSIIDRVLSNRTKHVTLVFEDIEKPHNVSAVLRTAECMGIQDIHFIENKKSYQENPTITQGSSKWLTLHHHNRSTNTVNECYQQLKNEGYKIYATSLHETATSLEDINAQDKIAIVFGTESDGITKEAGEGADGYVHIPMHGFTESLNLSVSAAICMTMLKTKLGGKFPSITDHEKSVLRATWYRKIVREADMILKANGITL